MDRNFTPSNQSRFVGFNFISNLTMFCQLFLCMFVGFNVRVECESLIKNCEEQSILRLAHDWLTSEKP